MFLLILGECYCRISYDVKKHNKDIYNNVDYSGIAVTKEG